MSNSLRVLIIEDTPERQKILTNLFRDHARILVHTAARAIRLIEAYTFDLIALDYDLSGPGKGDQVAKGIVGSRNSKAKILVHSMNDPGAQKIKKFLPAATLIPISKIIRNNETFKRIRQELQKGVDVNWVYVFRAQK